MIFDISNQNAIQDTEEQIALFFKEMLLNLNPLSVAQYLSSESANNQKVLEKFANALNFNNISFLDAMRLYLSNISIVQIEPKAIQKFLGKFAEIYIKQNPNDDIRDEKIAYNLANIALMLDNDIHNPNNKKHLSFKKLKEDMKNEIEKDDFKTELLQEIYNGVKVQAFQTTISKQQPFIEQDYNQLINNVSFKT